jgi:hypothetical protein
LTAFNARDHIEALLGQMYLAISSSWVNRWSKSSPLSDSPKSSSLRLGSGVWEIGVLTRDCIILYLTPSKTREALEGPVYQLMRVGIFALNHLTVDRSVRDEERDALRQLMTDSEYRGFGWSELKHSKALQLYRMCAARGWLDAAGPAMLLHGQP